MLREIKVALENVTSIDIESTVVTCAIGTKNRDKKTSRECATSKETVETVRRSLMSGLAWVEF